MLVNVLGCDIYCCDRGLNSKHVILASTPARWPLKTRLNSFGPCLLEPAV
jgi:hypothetical protein